MTKHIAFSRAGKNQHTVITHAFTMAEILLSLTIIGVVAAITLPSLTGNINERTWNTQRKALYARMSQAIALMPALNGYGTLTEETDSAGSTSITDTAAETFVTEGLAKVLKINNICDSEHLEDCGVPEKYTDLLGSPKVTPTTLYSLASYFQSMAWCGLSFSIPNTKAVAFETQNGESLITYYNPNCQASFLNSEITDSYGHTFQFVQTIMCVNFIYDLNGNKGPNTVGKDIGFLTAFNSTDPIVVAPMPANRRVNNGNAISYEEAISVCRKSDDTMRLPNIDELSSLSINSALSGLVGTGDGQDYWSGTKYSSTEVWGQDTDVGGRFVTSINDNGRVLCVQR